MNTIVGTYLHEVGFGPRQAGSLCTDFNVITIYHSVVFNKYYETEVLFLPQSALTSTLIFNMNSFYHHTIQLLK